MDRFSRSAVAAWAWIGIDALEREHGFDSRNGWAQVEGKGEAVNRAYGEYETLRGLVDAWGLAYPKQVAQARGGA